MELNGIPKKKGWDAENKNNSVLKFTPSSQLINFIQAQLTHWRKSLCMKAHIDSYSNNSLQVKMSLLFMDKATERYEHVMVCP